MLTGLVDTAFISRLSSASLAALGVGAMVLSGVFWIFNFLGIGTQTEVSQAQGRQDPKQAIRMSSLAIMLSLLFGLLLAVSGLVFAAPAARLMGAVDAVQYQAVTYMQLRLFGAPAVLMTIAAFGTLRGLQEMRTPLRVALGINVLNIFLDASSITAQSLVGYFIGAGQVAQARRVAAVVCLWSIAAGFGLTLVMLLGHSLATAAFVPIAAIAIFTPAWFVAALAQPVSALSFVTDGIRWGTGDYRYLRNVVTLATFCGGVAIIYLDEGRSGALTWIWVITAGWIIIRALFGVLRIWPGIGKSPLTIEKT